LKGIENFDIFKPNIKDYFESEDDFEKLGLFN